MKPPVRIGAIALLSGFGLVGIGQSPSECAENPTDDALARYAELTDTTILRAPGLPVIAESVTASLPAETNAAVWALKGALLERGVEMLPYRELFTLAVSSGWSNTPPAAQIDRIPAGHIGRSALPQVQGSNQEVIASGMIDFIHADGNQVLQLYSELTGKTLLRPPDIGRFQVKLRTQTPLNKAAAIYAMRAMFALRGLAVVLGGAKFEAILPIERAAAFKPHAPKLDPGDPPLDPKQIRDFRLAPATELVEYYAQLTGQQAVKESKRNDVEMIFKATTPLTKSEILYALRTLLAQEGLAVVQVDNKTLRLGRLDETDAVR
jgi:hypothetical protein